MLKKALIRVVILSALGTRLASSALCEEPKLEIDITHTSIEELLNMEVTSVSKRPEPWSKAAAAVFVLTNEDIRRSGATSIPEVLRLVPGVQVARIDANKWAVSIRGFNSRTANKLLVLVDGRTIYDPLFSGVLWETKDVMLEDVERIEVVRGPGGTLWGANAVNGVINIITKNAQSTQGALVSAGGGTEERGFGSARYGAAIGEQSFLRAYGKYLNRDEGYLPEGADDDSSLGQGGFRFDSEIAKRENFTIQGDLYGSRQGNPDNNVLRRTEMGGGNLLARWQKGFADHAELSLQGSYDYSDIDTAVLGENRDTFDFESQYRFAPWGIHQFIAGAGYWYSADDTRGSEFIRLDPSSQETDRVNVFIEDIVSLIEEELLLTIGSKFEHNDYTGFEYQPSLRLGWYPIDQLTFWSAISRAVRTPSRLEDDIVVTVPPDIVLQSGGELDTEDLWAYELGTGWQATQDLYFSLATFYNVYDHLLTLEGNTLGNKSSADTYGVELASSYKPLDWWRLDLAYTYLQIEFELDDDSLDDPVTRVEIGEGSDPEHTVSLRSRIELGSDWELDGGVRYVDSLPALDVSSYVVADVRLAYQLLKNWELSVVGQNLFEDHHFEQSPTAGTQVEDSVYGKLTWTF